MGKRFEDLLDECLKRIIAGEQTIEDCLATHPEEAAELEPLLRLALSVTQASSFKAPYGVRERIEYRIQAAFRERTSPRASPVVFWRRRWASAVAGLLALLLAGGGTVAASNRSLPDQPLYPVKLAAEQVQVSLTPQDMSKAQLYAKFIERRIQEQQRMAQRGRAAEMDMLTRRLIDHLDYIERISDKPALAPARQRDLAELRQRIRDTALKHQALYEEMLKQAPEPAKPALNQAREKSWRRYQDVLRSLNRDNGQDDGKGRKPG